MTERESPGKVAVRLGSIETRSIRAERWGFGDPSPDWASGDTDLIVSYEAQPEGRMAISIDFTARDDEPRAVRVELVCQFEVRVVDDGDDTGRGELLDTNDFLKNASDRILTAFADEALRVASPYMRESVGNLSLRVSPGAPIVLSSGIPEIGSSSVLRRSGVSTESSE